MKTIVQKRLGGGFKEMAKREGLKRKRAPAREDSNVVRLSLYIKDFFTINVAASRIVKAKINKLFWTM